MGLIARPGSPKLGRKAWIGVARMPAGEDALKGQAHRNAWRDTRRRKTDGFLVVGIE